MACDLGATRCLRKPFKTRELIEVVEMSCGAPVRGHDIARASEVFALECAHSVSQA
jgi:hypothetical protein